MKKPNLATIEAFLLLTILETIENDGIPSGHLYAALNSKGLTLEAYNARIEFLEKIKAIKIANHFITAGLAYPAAVNQLKKTLEEVKL